MTDAILPPLAAAPQVRPANEARLRALSQQLEAGFLAEMLGHAGMGEARESFGGGVGEEQFSSFLRQEQATAMVRAGGIGLAESFFRALTGGSHAKDGD